MSDPTEGWSLTCMVCRKGWPDDAIMDEIAEHWNEHEGEEFSSGAVTHVAEANSPYLELVWLGPGPAPKPRLRN